MTNLTHLLTPEHLESALIGYGVVAKVGGDLLRLLRPGTGQHRRPRR